jgi:putative zinc finger/helix-turn-helix YgiT family protein
MKTILTRDISQDLRCPHCDSTELESRLEIDHFDYLDGSTTVSLAARVTVHACVKCDFEFTDDSAEDARHTAVCNHLGVLTPVDITRLRHRNGLSRIEFARLTRIGEATIARWERGTLIQNAGYDQFLRLLSYPENIVRLKGGVAPETAVSAPEGLFQCLIVTAREREHRDSFQLQKTA